MGGRLRYKVHVEGEYCGSGFQSCLEDYSLAGAKFPSRAASQCWKSVYSLESTSRLALCDDQSICRSMLQRSFT